jgi:hypothetical protein
VIKNIAYYPSQCAQNAPPVLDAFLQGCASHGIATVANSWDADAAVIWSVLWNGRMQANRRVYQHYRAQGKPVICIDIGALKRGITWKVAVNNINADGYYGHCENLDFDRPRKLQVAMQQPKLIKPAILIAAQHPLSLQVENIDQSQWFAKVLTELNTDLPVVLRPHPRGRIDYQCIAGKVSVQHGRPLPKTYDSFDIDYAYQLVINYNSGAGVQAALLGANVLVDKSSLAYTVSKGMDKTQWLVEICHTEYTLHEIAAATWLKRIGHRLEL